MRILVDKKLKNYMTRIMTNNQIKMVKASKLMKEYQMGTYDIVIGLNIHSLRSDGKTYIISVGNDYDNKEFDDVISLPVTSEKIEQAILKTGLSRTSQKYRAILNTIESIINYKSADAGKQTKNVACIVRLICEVIYQENIVHLTRDQIDQIVAFSSIHDIGKIGIPDHILTSTKIYTEDERRIMREHPLIGVKILNDLMEKNKIENYTIAYNIIKFHHEKYDGTGYPQGLKGIEIPIEARIVTIADIYDALVSKRTYKRAYSHQEALEEIKHGIGTQFDPYIVKCFLKEEHKIRKLYDDDFNEEPGYIFAKDGGENKKVFIFALTISLIMLTLIIIAIIKLLGR